MQDIAISLPETTQTCHVLKDNTEGGSLNS